MQKSILNWALQNSDPTLLAQQAERTDRAPIDPRIADAILGESDAVRMRREVVALQSAASDPNRRLEALEQLEYFCESLDNANDLLAVGGLACVLEHCAHPSACVRAAALSLLGVCSRNNPPFQQQLLDLHDPSSAVSAQVLAAVTVAASNMQLGSPKLHFVRVALDAMANDSDLAVRNKALFAVTGTISIHQLERYHFRSHNPLCFVRNWQPALNLFVQYHGSVAILRALENENNDVRFVRRALFFLAYILQSVPSSSAHVPMATLTSGNQQPFMVLLRALRVAAAHATLSVSSESEVTVLWCDQEAQERLLEALLVLSDAHSDLALAMLMQPSGNVSCVSSASTATNEAVVAITPADAILVSYVQALTDREHALSSSTSHLSDAEQTMRENTHVLRDLSVRLLVKWKVLAKQTAAVAVASGAATVESLTLPVGRLGYCSTDASIGNSKILPTIASTAAQEVVTSTNPVSGCIDLAPVTHNSDFPLPLAVARMHQRLAFRNSFASNQLMASHAPVFADSLKAFMYERCLSAPCQAPTSTMVLSKYTHDSLHLNFPSAAPRLSHSAATTDFTFSSQPAGTYEWHICIAPDNELLSGATSLVPQRQPPLSSDLSLFQHPALPSLRQALLRMSLLPPPPPPPTLPSPSSSATAELVSVDKPSSLNMLPLFWRRTNVEYDALPFTSRHDEWTSAAVRHKLAPFVGTDRSTTRLETASDHELSVWLLANVHRTNAIDTVDLVKRPWIAQTAATIQAAVHPLVPTTLSHLAFVPPLMPPALIPVDSHPEALSSHSRSPISRFQFNSDFWCEALSIMQTAFAAVRFESLVAAGALHKAKRPQVVIHTKDWLPPLTDLDACTDTERSHRRATARALCLCQLIAADACGIDELIFHAPDEESQITYRVASRLYWSLIASTGHQQPHSVGGHEFGCFLEAVVIEA